MKKGAFLFFILAVMTATSALAADAARMDAAESLAAADKNGDHHVNLKEYQQRMTEVFFLIDSNKDGELTEGELGQVEKIDPKRFAAADEDGSLTLSLQEYLHALDVDFEAADRNGDGLLDVEELRLIVEK